MDVEFRKEENITTFGGDAFSTENSLNIITVNVAESFKTEDEISFIKQVIAQEKKMHDPAIILPTDLEMYAKDMKSSKMENTFQNKLQQHKCRKKNCDQLFNTLTERALHETHEHKNAPRFIKCNFCHEVFENFFALTRHMSKHSGEQRYICSHCTKNFISYQELQIHWKTSVACKSNEQDLKNLTRLNQNSEVAHAEEYVASKKNKFAEGIESKDLFPKLSTDFVEDRTLTTSKPLTFADEVKTFAAKYQLKTVARKRTSAFTLKPVQKGKKRKFMDFDIEPTYAVPKAANNFIYPFQNLKIKQEPIDSEEMAAETQLDADLFDKIQIKNEPHDDYENSIGTNFTSSEEISESSPINQHKDDVPPIKTAKNIESDQLHEQTAEFKPFQINRVVNPIQTMQTLETIVKAGQPQAQPPRKIMLSKANLLSMKNVKILKLGSSAKLVKCSPLTSPVGSPEDKNLNGPSLIFHNIFSDPVELDIDSTKVLAPDQIKVEQNNEDNDNKANVMSNVVEDFLQNQQHVRVLPKWLIRFMEEQPQKRKIIDDLQRQFQNATEVMKKNTPTLTVPNDSAPSFDDKPNLNSLKTACEAPSSHCLPCLPENPESFYLKVTDSSDKELMIARRHYRNYFYAWICPMCYKEYTQKHTFINHLIGTHKICAEKLKTLTVEVKPFLLQTVKPEQNLSSTQKSKDEETLKPRFECPKCKQTYITKQAIIDHQNSGCGLLPLYVCNVCSKPFASRSTLNCHMTIHTGELNFKCKYCDKRFRTNGQVRVHLRKHTGEKPFKCQICTLAFTHRETLISHFSRHMDIKRYICKGCNKRFSTISALTTHRNVRPTTCGILELDTQAVGPLIRVTNGEVKFEPQRCNNVRTRRKMCQEILNEIQNIPKIKKELELDEEHPNQSSSPVIE